MPYKSGGFLRDHSKCHGCNYYYRHMCCIAVNPVGDCSFKTCDNEITMKTIEGFLEACKLSLYPYQKELMLEVLQKAQKDGAVHIIMPKGVEKEEL